MMKFLVVAALLSVSSAWADEQAEKDFFVICESSKFAAALRKGPFKDAAERAYLVAKMQESLVSGESAKNALRGISQADFKQRMELLKRAAKESGVKNWNCPTIGELYR